jgi:sugar phosphate isomerase/epimerase
MLSKLGRRTMLSATAGIAGSLLASTTQAAPRESSAADASPNFRYCLNTSTIRGQKLGIVREIELAAQAGYDAIEPWVRELDEYTAGGGSIDDLAKRIADLGLTVESAIAFFPWGVDDEAERKKALVEARRNMDLLKRLGGKRIAAPPVGLTQTENVDLRRVGERFRKVVELGEQTGIWPELEVWGHSKTLGRLSEALYVAAEANHPNTLLLLDVYHLHRGGSGFDGLRLVSGQSMGVMHVNDYPGSPSHEKLTDADRVYPGDGAAPLAEIFRTLRERGFRGYLSLELFNKDYWTQDPLAVLKTGLEKTRAAVASSS